MTNTDVFNPYSYAKTNLNHHHYQFTTSSHENLITQTARSQNTHFTTSQNSSIAPSTPNSDTQNNRYKPQSPQSQQQQSQQQPTSITLQNPDHNNRQYASNQQQSSIMAPSLNSPTSPLTSTQCVQNPTTTTTGTNNVTSLASPVSMATPPNIPASLSSNNNQTVLTNNFDLQEILSQFGTQPDLLKIILTSKIEEDKRRAEEAKLRIREIDLMLLDRFRQRRFAEHVEGMDVSNNNNNNNHEEQLILNNEFDYDIHDNYLGTYPTPDGPLSTYTVFNNNLPSSTQNISIDNNSISSSNIHSKCMARIKLSSKNESTSQEQLTNDLNSNTPNQNNNNDNDNNDNNNDDEEDCGLNGTPSKRKRKRREMLAVTMIIETKENPYKDSYLWKNNGNTTQRKTGKKSVYYKCSNSNKGCPVNKTVTETDDGWLIKYRGHHIEDCGKIKRIVHP